MQVLVLMASFETIQDNNQPLFLLHHYEVQGTQHGGLYWRPMIVPFLSCGGNADHAMKDCNVLEELQQADPFWPLFQWKGYVQSISKE
jgi:hypothetical protein